MRMSPRPPSSQRTTDACSRAPMLQTRTPRRHCISHRACWRGYTFGQLGEVAALNEVVRLEKDFTQARLAYRVVLEIELVKPMERVHMRLNVADPPPPPPPPPSPASACSHRRAREARTTRRTHVHVERVDAEVVCSQLERLKHLFQRQMPSVAEDDHVLGRGTRTKTLMMHGHSTPTEKHFLWPGACAARVPRLPWEST
jgi:hypothetical protein